MLKFLRKIRKGFRTACLTVALTTCWGIGQTAQAAWDTVTFKLTGTVSPTQHNISNLYLLYGINYSFVHEYTFVNLGNFTTGVTSDLSLYMTVPYDESMFDSPDKNMYWEAVGLYGDISGDYNDQINGVTLGINAAEGDPWSLYSGRDEGYVFDQLKNNSEDYLSWTSGFYPWHPIDFQYQSFNLTINLFDFSNASPNGQIQLNAEVVPEPISIVLFGGGGMFVIAFRRRNK